MTLGELEAVCVAMNDAMMTGTSFETELENRGLRSHIAEVLQLLEDGQLYVLIDIRRAEQNLDRALAKLTDQTEYLREELEQALQHMRVLLLKTDAEEALRRDRDALLSGFPSSYR